MRLLSGGLTAALTVSLVGCAAGSSASSSAGSLDNVVVAVGALPDSLTPAPWGGSASHVVLSGLGSQLLEYKTDASGGQSCPATSVGVSGRLAESVEPTADGTGVVVALRSLTSQFGNTLSAEDVRWSLEIGMKRQPVMAGTLKSSGFNVDDLVKVIDPRTVQLNTTGMNSFTVESLQNNLFYIHDSTEAKKHVTADDPTANNWLSKNLADYSGWDLEEFSPGTSLTVTADPDWGGERGAVRRVVVKAVPNTATRSQLVESGEVQVGNGFDYDQYKSLEGAPGVAVINCPSQTRDTMMFNTKTGPLAEEKVRQAISMAIDREALVKGAYAGYGEAAGSIFPMVEGSASYKFDTEGAKKLLAEAGYANGFPLTLTYSTTRPGPVAAKSSVLIQSMLKEIGIDVELKNVASTTDFSTALLDGRYQAALYAEPIVIADPAFYSYAFYVTGAPSNSTGWSDSEFDKTRIELAATPLDEAEKRTDLLNKMTSRVDAGAPILSLVETRGMLVAKEGLPGAAPLTNGQIYFNALGR
ncbi:ABC transporter substrate-binding protein [Arthrobacter ginkgonis]|uniref:ABC transporter substrate-binding protein n=1 Tax=Arthrobacter ginkgonis TaxID=1630594 RepID=UPI0031E9F699